MQLSKSSTGQKTSYLSYTREPWGKAVFDFSTVIVTESCGLGDVT